VNGSVSNSWFKLLAVGGIIALAGLVLVLIASPCGWSFLMDDVTFLHWMPQANDVLQSWRQAFGTYWDQGRFFPLTFLINILKWRFLPLDPAFFRVVNTALLLAGVGLGSWRIVRAMPEAASKWPALLFLLGFAALHRPLLDIAAINSISEGWVVLFFAAGMLAIDRHPILYRLAFLACAMSKEPAILAFFASGVYQLLRGRGIGVSSKSGDTHGQDGHATISGCVDLAIFATLAVLMAKAKSSGPYLEHYSLFGMANIKRFAIGLVKCSIGLIPVAILFFGAPKGILRKVLTDDTTILCALFGLPYLYLAASWNVTGYLLIPATFCVFIIGGVAILELSKNEQLMQRVPFAFLAAFALILCVSLYRFDRTIRSIHEPLIALKALFSSPTPQLVILQGEEEVLQGNIIVKESGANVTLKQYNPDNMDGIADFPGDVVLLEATSYFGRLPDAQIEAIGAKAGGWTQRVDGDVYRLFFAKHKP